MSDSYGTVPGAGNEPGLPPIELPSLGVPPPARPRIVITAKPPAASHPDGAVAATMAEYGADTARAAVEHPDGSVAATMPEYGAGTADQQPTPEPGFLGRVQNLWEHPPKGPSIVGDLLKPAWDALTLPGDVVAGKVSPDEELDRARGAAQFMSPVSAGTRAGVGFMGVRNPAPAVAPVISAAERTGIDLPSAIAHPSTFRRVLGQAVSKAPGGGVLSRAIEKATSQTEGAVMDTAASLGSGEAAQAGATFTGAIKGTFKPAIKKVVDDAYTKVGEFVDPNIKTPLEATTAAVSKIMGERTAGALDPYSGAVKLVADGVTRPGGLSYQGIKTLRTTIGEMIDTGMFPEGMSQAELRALYGALTRDLEKSVANAGGEKAAQAWRYANTLAKNAATWKESIAKVVGPKSRASEGVAATIVRMAGRGPTADIETLMRARLSVPKDAWREISSYALARLGRDKAGDFSPARFFSDYGNLSAQGKRALFSGVGSENVLPFLNEINRVSEAFSKAGKLGNPSGTASHGAAAGILVAAATGIAHGSMIEPISAATAALGAYGTARVLARPATAAAMARWARASLAFKQRPSIITSTALAREAVNFAHTANSYGISFSPKELLKATQGTQPVSADEQPTQ